MPDQPDKAQYLAWAARARVQFGHATTEAARALHREIARDYEEKAARADANPPDLSE